MCSPGHHGRGGIWVAVPLKPAVPCSCLQPSASCAGAQPPASHEADLEGTGCFFLAEGL